MIYDKDSLWRKPRETTARRKRRRGVFGWRGKTTEWPSKRMRLTIIRPSDSCKGDPVFLAVDQWYDFHEFGCHLGNDGPILLQQHFITHLAGPERRSTERLKQEGANKWAVRWRSILETVASGYSFRSLRKQSKDYEAASFSLIASLTPTTILRR